MLYRSLQSTSDALAPEAGINISCYLILSHAISYYRILSHTIAYYLTLSHTIAGSYNSVTQQLMTSDHSPVGCGFSLSVKQLPDLPVSVYKLRMFNAKVSSGVNKMKHIKMVTPAPFEVVDRLPAAKKLPFDDISGAKVFLVVPTALFAFLFSPGHIPDSLIVII
eukprot:SAG31_NODE_3313_length_4429_cov_1.345958_3_plen_165_part_00